MTFVNPTEYVQNGISYLWSGNIVVVDGEPTPDYVVVPHSGFYRESVSITVDGDIIAKVQYTLDNPRSSGTVVWKDWPYGSADGSDPTKLTVDGGLQAPVGGLRVAVTSGSGNIHFVVRETTFR